MAHTKIYVFFLLMMAFLGVSLADTYHVGDSSGWNNQGTDYNSWASTKNFQVGDTIVFNYNPQIYDVVQVTKEDYEACSFSVPLTTYDSGSDSIQLFASGNFYFICSYPGMCQAGQKVQITVSSAFTSNPTPITPDVPPFTNPPPPPRGDASSGIYPYYFHHSPSNSSAPFSYYHHLGLLIFASCVFLFVF